MMTIRLAWKNIWRHRLRSTVVGLAYMMGILAGTFTIAFLNGMVEQRVRSIVGIELAHLQIHQRGYLEQQDASCIIRYSDSLAASIAAMPHVAGVAKRLRAKGMVVSNANSCQATIVGVVPQQERKISTLKEKILIGDYPSGDGLLIGKRMADRLGCEINSPVFLSIRDSSGKPAEYAFTVSGIFATDNASFDEQYVMVDFSRLAKCMGNSDQGAHEIAVLMSDSKQVDSMKKRLQRDFPELEVKDWLELSPEAAALISLMGQYRFIILIVILLALCFGIINIMLMAVLERKREIAMLMAIGMSHGKVFLMIVYECVFLAFLGGIIGACLAIMLIWQLGIHGMNLSFWSDAFSDVGFSSLVYPSIDIASLLGVVALVVVSGLLSGTIPAYRALRSSPSLATRIE
jgi:ABC-type lipoprotein release transport system permease subunit